MKKYTNELLTYGHNENSKFQGLMGGLIDLIGGIGESDITVKSYGNDIKGSDALEVIDEDGLMIDDSDFIPDFTKDRVILKADYAPATPIILTEGNTTIQMNNKTITAPLFTESGGNVIEGGNSDSYALWVKNGAELNIKGRGEIIAQDAKYSMAVWAQGGVVNIYGGTFYNGGDNCDLVYVSNGGKVYIYGGEFFPHGPASGDESGTKNPYTALNIKDRDRGTCELLVYGGIFHNFDPANNVSEGEGTNFVAEGYKSVEIEPNVWEVVPE